MPYLDVPRAVPDRLTPAQAQQCFADQDMARMQGLARGCLQALGVGVGVGIAGVVSDRPGLIGLGMLASTGLLWREHRRIGRRPAIPCAVGAALGRWIDSQEHPRTTALALAQEDRYGEAVRAAAVRHLQAMDLPRT